MQKIALPLVATLLALAAAGAHAQSYWKWRDAAGQLHITDTPPPAGTPAKNVLASPGAPAPGATVVTPAEAGAAAAPASSAPAATALELRKKAADQAKADQDKAARAALAQKNEAIRKDNCVRAQNALTGLQSGVRVANVNAQGEREFLDDAGRAAEIRRTQGVIADNCGPAPASAP